MLSEQRNIFSTSIQSHFTSNIGVKAKRKKEKGMKETKILEIEKNMRLEKEHFVGGICLHIIQT